VRPVIAAVIELSSEPSDRSPIGQSTRFSPATTFRATSGRQARHRDRAGVDTAIDASALVEHRRGEVARYVAKYGQLQGRVAKAVLVSAVRH
jgi:hypothetical protein